MADEAIIRIKLEKSDLDDAKQGGDSGGSGGAIGPGSGSGGQTAAQRNERRGEGATGDPEEDKPLTRGALDRILEDHKRGREDEGKRRAGEREAMDKAIVKANAGDATSLGELQKAHGLSDSALAGAVGEHKRRTDAEVKQKEASHVQQGKAVAAAASGNLGPIAQIAKGALTTAAGPEVGAVLGTAGVAAGIASAAAYGAMYASAVGSALGEYATGIKGNQGDTTGAIRSIIVEVKKAFNLAAETAKAARAVSFFPAAASDRDGDPAKIVRGIAGNLAVQAALDAQDLGIETDEIKMMVKNFLSSLPDDVLSLVAKQVWGWANTHKWEIAGAVSPLANMANMVGSLF